MGIAFRGLVVEYYFILLVNFFLRINFLNGNQILNLLTFVTVTPMLIAVLECFFTCEVQDIA
jgi:hypothetical protein